MRFFDAGHSHRNIFFSPAPSSDLALKDYPLSLKNSGSPSGFCHSSFISVSFCQRGTGAPHPPWDGYPCVPAVSRRSLSLTVSTNFSISAPSHRLHNIVRTYHSPVLSTVLPVYAMFPIKYNIRCHQIPVRQERSSYLKRKKRPLAAIRNLFSQFSMLYNSLFF